MEPLASRNEQSYGENRVDVDFVRVGKDVIELLTSGMYVSPITVYREYVQNAADSIDAARTRGLLSNNEGHISIAMDHARRSITIRDDGAGITQDNVMSSLLAIGGSPKRGSGARGFRGVGRLSGLAYCRALSFRTKAEGEAQITTVTWDCRALRERLRDSAFTGDLKHVIADVVSVCREPGDKEAHFFEVCLCDVMRLRNDILLNEQMISHYLGQVAPVPFSPDFSVASDIERRLSAVGRRAPIETTVAGESVRRPYRDEIALPGSVQKLSIRGIEFFEFADVDGDTGAIAWIAHHEYVRSISTTLGVRGIRARLGDLQVGEANLFDDSFKEPRFNGWSIGEVHVLDPRIVPNARRDNFEVNHHFYNLLVQLGPLAAKIAQRCRSASVSRNAEQMVRNAVSAVEDRIRQKRPFDRTEHSRLKSAILRACAKSKSIADTRVRQSLERKLDRLKIAIDKRRPKRGASAVALDEAVALVSKFVTNRDQARKLIEELRQLCG